MQTDNEPLVRRLERVEKTNRTLAVCLSLLSAGVVLTLLLGAQQAAGPQRGAAFQVVDQNGKVRISLELSNRNEPRVVMMDENGERNIILGTNQGKTELALFDDKDRMAVNLGTGVVDGKDSSISSLTIRDLSQGNIIRSADVSGGSLDLASRDIVGLQREGKYHSSGWNVRDIKADQTRVAQLSNDVTNQVSSLIFTDGDFPSLRMGLYQGGRSWISLNNPGDKTEIRSTVERTGSAEFSITDKAGKVVFAKP